MVEKDGKCAVRRGVFIMRIVNFKRRGKENLQFPERSKEVRG